jgi:hypothetical protein
VYSNNIGNGKELEMAITIGAMNRALAPLGVSGGHFNNSGSVSFNRDDIEPLSLRSLWHMDVEDVLRYVQEQLETYENG